MSGCQPRLHVSEQMSDCLNAWKRLHEFRLEFTSAGILFKVTCTGDRPQRKRPKHSLWRCWSDVICRFGRRHVTLYETESRLDNAKYENADRQTRLFSSSPSVQADLLDAHPTSVPEYRNNWVPLTHSILQRQRCKVSFDSISFDGIVIQNLLKSGHNKVIGHSLICT